MPGHPCHVAARIFDSFTGCYRSQVTLSQIRAFECPRSRHRTGLRRRGASDRRHSAPHDTSVPAWELQATPIYKIWQLLKQLPPAATLPYLVGGLLRLRRAPSTPVPHTAKNCYAAPWPQRHHRGRARPLCAALSSYARLTAA